MRRKIVSVCCEKGRKKMIEIPRARLETALKAVMPCVDTKSTIPILSCVRFGDGKIVASNQRMQAVVDFDVDAGDFCVEAAKLSGFATRTAGDIRFDLSDHRLKVSAGRSRVELPILDARDFPIFEHPDGEEFAVNGAVLDCLLRPLAGFEAEAKIARPSLEGPTIISDGALIRGYASNGVKLMATSIKVAAPVFSTILQPDMPVPGTRNASDEVLVRIGRNLVTLRAGEVAYTAKLIDAEVVAWERLAANTPETKEPALVEAEDLLRSLDAARSVVEANAVAKSRRITLSGDHGVLHVHAGHPAGEEFFDELDCDGDFKSAALNGDFLATILRALGGEGSIAFHRSDASIRFTRAGNDRDFAILAVMG